jgi:hypothetical protein
VTHFGGKDYMCEHCGKVILIFLNEKVLNNTNICLFAL